ncbi:hypothetical protein GPL21_40860 [Bradyrhizobium pachyrhizi]|uniref:Uncharacterized protein n=1 Tax=Bradyrhizobium pachyrhizi TaxID=280333 RepID=A0A844T9M8_9BRAD|nr:hypothetical protein [Bradyrhizobium pachyrhizi]MVT71340.1 hypothetical protein [Bradyrhizobium pachyrhizi]
MSELTGIAMAASALAASENGGIDRKKVSVCASTTNTMPKANCGEPAAFSVKGNDGAARIIHPPALSMREVRT